MAIGNSFRTFAVFVLAAGMGACGGIAVSDGAPPEAGSLDSSAAAAADAGSDGTVELDASEVACPGLPLGDGSLTWVTGTVAGGSVRATLCPGAAAMYFEDLGPMYAPAAFGYLSGGLPLYAPGLVFDVPRTAVAWQLEFELDGVFAEGATYESPDGGGDVTVEFEYVIPDSPGIDCTPDASTTCPPGCDVVQVPCLERCGPVECRPHGTLFDFVTDYYSPYTRTTEAEPATIHVAAVDPPDAGALCPVHASFEATLVNVDDGPDTMTVNMSF